ncbi:MAG: phospholipase D-like domain-containing protein, partial [Bacteroidota bacterium]
PYFVPDGGVLTALQVAALRGVDVRVLIPRKADHLPFKFVHYAYLHQTEPAGVQIYRYDEGFMHQKVCLVDDDFAAVGTANLDNRSFRLNFELTMLYADRAFAGDVAAMLARDFARSTPLTLADYQAKSFPFRLAVRATQLIAPVL